MPDTFTKISTVTVGSGGASSIDFTSIPSTYTDLQIVLSSRKTTSGVTDIGIRMNSVTTGYNFRSMGGNGSTVNSTSFTNMSYYYVEDAVTSSTATSNTFGSAVIYIPDYNNSISKAFAADAVTEDNATTAYQRLSSGLGTTATITSLSLTPGSGSFAQYTTATLYGIASPAAGAKATGGIISSDNSYIYHTFLASGTFTPTQSLSCDMLVVAGGAGGSFDEAGGGGAGGLLALTSQSLSATGYTVTIGGGGAGGYGSTTTTRKAANGTNSSFGGLGTAIGGGSGGQWNLGDASTGGSGGGGSVAASGAYDGAAGTSGQGNAGGSGSYTSAANRAGGGGGGAGGAGGNGVLTGSGTGGSGGVGSSTYSSWLSTVNVGQNVGGTYYIAGGGGGFCGNTGGTSGPGGYGGGGTSGNYVGSVVGTNGTANTGGGAGAGPGTSASTQVGGSGVVIVRYAK